MQAIKQGLYSHPVSDKEQSSALFLPHTKGKNTVEPVHAGILPLGIGMKHHLGIRMSGKDMPQCLQIAANLLCIVKLSVVYNPIEFSTIGKSHGLPSPLGVDDRKPGVKKGTFILLINIRRIGPSAFHGLKHILDIPIR